MIFEEEVVSYSPKASLGITRFKIEHRISLPADDCLVQVDITIRTAEITNQLSIGVMSKLRFSTQVETAEVEAITLIEITIIADIVVLVVKTAGKL